MRKKMTGLDKGRQNKKARKKRRRKEEKASLLLLLSLAVAATFHLFFPLCRRNPEHPIQVSPDESPSPSSDEAAAAADQRTAGRRGCRFLV